MSKTTTQAGQMGVERPLLMRCPRGFVGKLETLCGRFLGGAAQAALIAGELGMASGVESGNVVSDKNVIVNCPQNTSGFSTYIAQVPVILGLF